MARRVQPNGNPAQAAGPIMAPNPLNQDVKAMLCKSQPGYFSGEGDDVGKQLKEWLEKMDNYFTLAHSTEEQIFQAS